MQYILYAKHHIYGLFLQFRFPTKILDSKLSIILHWSFWFVDPLLRTFPRPLT